MNKLPTPQGYRLLVKPREIEVKTKGGIILADQTREAQKFAVVCSQVISMGSDCYQDMEKSKSKWCKTGDWILTGKYVGLKFMYAGEEYSIINDDEVVATIPDPTKIASK